MADIFGIAFSEKNWQISHLKTTEAGAEILSVKELEYPFPFAYDSFFDRTNFSLMALAIKEEKMQKGITDLEISVSLPVNFAAIKRVALPAASDPAALKEQAQWELTSSLTGKLSDYKIIKTDSQFDFGEYSEHLFIAIHKEILQLILNVVEKIHTKLKRVWLDTTSYQSFLVKNGLSDPEKNQFLVKIDSFQIKSHLFIKGQYYHTYIDQLPLNAQGAIDEIEVLSVILQRFNASKNLIQQLPMATSEQIQFFFLGTELTNGLKEIIMNHFASAMHLTATINGSPTHCIEAVGLLLDQ